MPMLTPFVVIPNIFPQRSPIKLKNQEKPLHPTVVEVKGFWRHLSLISFRLGMFSIVLRGDAVSESGVFSILMFLVSESGVLVSEPGRHQKIV